MKTICIMCPIGCELEIDEKTKSVSGNKCPRGAQYGLNEITCPSRIVTSVVKIPNGTMSVKTTAPVPKEKINEVLKEIEKIKINKPKNNQILIKNILNTNADIVVTGIFYL